MQKSRSFILPMFDIPTAYLTPYLLDTYLGEFNFYSDDTWGEHFFLHYYQLNEDQKDYYESHDRFISHIELQDGTSIVVLSITAKERKNIVLPFLNGEYSKIDRKYVTKYFSSTVNGNVSTNWLILNKSNSLRQYWEKRIGITLPADAEVWSKPKKEDEILNYEDFLIQQISHEEAFS